MLTACTALHLSRETNMSDGEFFVFVKASLGMSVFVALYILLGSL